MSVPKKAVVLSPDAKRDFSAILLYSLQEYPLFPGCRIRPVGRHVLYYRIENGSIEVVRILHERADPARHLRP